MQRGKMGTRRGVNNELGRSLKRCFTTNSPACPPTFRMSTTGSTSSTTTTATVPPRLRVPRTPAEGALAGSMLMHSSSAGGAPDEDSDSDTASTTTPKPGPASSPAPDATLLKLRNLMRKPPVASSPSAEQPASARTPSEHESDFELDSEEGHSAFKTPRANGSSHRASIKELFHSASRPVGDSPLKRRTGSFAEEGSPRPGLLGRSLSDDDNEREKSSSLSLHFSKSTSFDLLKDSMHMPDVDMESSDSMSRTTDTPPQPPPLVLPPSPDSPRLPSTLRQSPVELHSGSNTPSTSNPMSLETPRPQPPKRSVSPIASTSTSLSISMFDSVISKRAGKQSTPEPAPLLPVELTTPIGRRSSLAAEIARGKAAQLQQQKQQATALAPQSPPQTPMQEQAETSTSPPNFDSPDLEPKTPRVPGHLEGMTPRPTGRGGGHRRSPTIGSVAEWDALNIPSGGSPLTDKSNNLGRWKYPSKKLETTTPQKLEPTTPQKLEPTTPRPPGAYAPTPGPTDGSAKKGGTAKKVRFHPSVHGGTSGDESIIGTPSKQPALGPTATPSGGIRFMDEYGRERRFAEDGSEIMLKPPSGGTPVRQKDGRRSVSPEKQRDKEQLQLQPITSAPPLKSALSSTTTTTTGFHSHRKSHSPNWEAIRKGLSELHTEFDAESKRASAANTQLSTPSDSSTETPARLSDLAERSRKARAKRGKLKSRVDSAYDAMRGWIRLPGLPSSRSSLIWMALLLTLLLWAVFRLAHSHALYLYSHSYFDPLHPSIYQYGGQVQWLTRPLPTAWAPFAVPGWSGPRETYVGSLLRDCERWLLGSEPPARAWNPT